MLFIEVFSNTGHKEYKFPSPYGVSFILMLKMIGNKGFFNIARFPSPCGALFILMGYGSKTKCKIKLFKVSVSLWSIIHSYVLSKAHIHMKRILEFPSPCGVSFILMFLRFNYLLWLIIRFHLLMEYSSFLWRKICFISTQKIKSFCLLSEYYSFLWLDEKKVYRALRWRFRLLAKYHSFLFFILNGFLKHSLKSFRLLAEYHSFLLNLRVIMVVDITNQFPSPYGVSFILMC